MMKNVNLFESAWKRGMNKKIKMLKEEVETDAVEQALADTDSIDDGSEGSALEQAIDNDTEFTPPEQSEEAQRAQEVLSNLSKKNDELIQDWAKKLDAFCNFMNDPENKHSVMHILQSAAEGSVLDKIRSAEVRQIKSLAADAASLSQSLKSYIGNAGAAAPTA